MMVIATSDSMAFKILARLGLKDPKRIVRIEDVSTAEEIKTARKERYGKGQHVIPVSQALVRKNFAGKLVGHLRVFWSGKEQGEAEKTIVRPPFSFYGEVHIEPEAIKQLVAFVSSRTAQVSRVNEIKLSPDENGLSVEVQITVLTGVKNFVEIAEAVKKRVSVSVKFFTGLDIKKINVVVAEVLL